MIKKINRYIAFADESNHNKGRYRSISLVVLHETEFDLINNKLEYILDKYDLRIKSFKWEKLKSKKKVLALKELLDYLFGLMLDGSLKIHVLIWDIEDSRHSIVGRDDIKNLSIMYYKLIKNFVQDNLYDKETLTIYPDRNNALDWNNLEDIFINDGILIDEKGLFTLLNKKVIFEESNTLDDYLIQIADIFAGLARTSYEDYDKYEYWLSCQQTLIPLDKNISNKQECHFEIYKKVDEWAKSYKLRISLKSNGGFHSYDKYGPLNFWFYTPQHDEDKAPKKEKR